MIGGIAPSHEAISQCFHQPFPASYARVPSLLTPEAYTVHMALRRTLLPRSGYPEGFTGLQQLLLLHILTHEPLDIVDFLLAEIEDVIRNNKDVVVIVDEAYVDFGAESALSLIDKYDNLLVVRTYSKSRSLAGLRIGYAFGCEKLIKYLLDAKFSFNSYTMNMPSLKLGAAAMKDKEYFEETVAKVVATREKFKVSLRELGFEFADSATNFVFARHPQKPGKEIFEYLRSNGIIVRRFDKPRISEYLRISIGTDEEMDKLVSTLKEYL